MFRVIMMSFFILGYYFSLRISESYTIARAISNILETRPINFNSDAYSNITSKDDIHEFISNVVITQIYDDSVKEYEPLVEGYHYLSNFNYFMGMRMTHNRVELEDYDGAYSESIHKIRKSNYDQKPNIRYDNLDTSTFGTSYPTKYCSG